MRPSNRGQVMGPHPWGAITTFVIGAVVGINLDPFQVGATSLLFGAVAGCLAYASYCVLSQRLYQAIGADG